jgi:hypothetical protein
MKIDKYITHESSPQKTLLGNVLGTIARDYLKWKIINFTCKNLKVVESGGLGGSSKRKRSLACNVSQCCKNSGRYCCKFNDFLRKTMFKKLN